MHGLLWILSAYFVIRLSRSKGMWSEINVIFQWLLVLLVQELKHLMSAIGHNNNYLIGTRGQSSWPTENNYNRTLNNYFHSTSSVEKSSGVTQYYLLFSSVLY